LLKRLEITNYRSITKAQVVFRPFTVLVGANGSGKSNLLKLLVDLSVQPSQTLVRHFRLPQATTDILIETSHGHFTFQNSAYPQGRKPPELGNVRLYSIDPNTIGLRENIVPVPEVHPNGAGAIRVLDSLKTGDREDLFETIERQLHEFVPEIEKLSFTPGSNQKSLQVREKGISTPVPVSELSEGTRLVLTILTIVHQERRPSIICLEDIDRGLHPALFGKLVDVCRSLVRVEGAPQIVATTQNPYFVDQFIDDEDSIVLVEKTDASTTFTSLRERLEHLGGRHDDSLGSIWYSGLVGGTPLAELKHLPKTSGSPSPE
jgi:predicted ATPase